jgi:transposase
MRNKSFRKNDGLFVLRTDTDHDAETIARVYKMLWMVEDSFRTAKSIMETRPIFHKCDETIRGHVFCSFLALVLKRELEIRMEQKPSFWLHAALREAINHKNGVAGGDIL